MGLGTQLLVIFFCIFFVVYYVIVFIGAITDEYRYKKDLLIDLCIPFGMIPRLLIGKLRGLK